MAFGSLQGIIGRAGGNEVIGRGVIDVGVSSYRIRHDMRSVTRAISTESKLWGQAFRLAALGFAAVGTGMVAAVVGGIAAAEKFNAAMARVRAMTGVTTEQFEKMREGILELSQSLPQGPEALAKGLYFIASAGFRGAEALLVLDQAAKAAAASGADLEVSADALVSVMNAYGLAADQAAYASDIMTKTVVFGKVEFEDLAKAIGPVATISRVAGISLEEMGASLSMLTSRGLTARRATNSLWATLRALAKPTEQQWKMIKKLGLQFKPEDLDKKGLIAVLREFDRAVKDWTLKTTGQKVIATKIYNKDGSLNIEASQKEFEKMNRGYFDQMGKLVGQSNAFLVSQILLQETGETFDFYMDKMNDSVTTTNNAFKEASKLDFGIIWGKFTSKLMVALIALGERFLPALATAIDWLGENLPSAIAFFGNVLDTVLFPAIQAAWEGISRLLGVIGDVLNFSGSKEDNPLQTFFGVFVNLITHALEVVGSLSNALADLLSNPVIASLARFAALWGAVALAFSAMRTASAGLASRFSGIAKTMSFGKVTSNSGVVSGTQAAGDGGLIQAAARLMASAGEQLLAARALQAAAFKIEWAASRLGFLGQALAKNNFQTRLPNGRFGRKEVIPPWAVPTVGPNPMFGPAVPPGFNASIAQQAAVASKGMIATAAGSMVNALKTGASTIGNTFKSGLGFLGKLVWPILLADIAGAMLGEPLGNIVSSIPGFKNAGEQLKTDFWGGLGSIAANILTGGKSDFLAGLPDKVKLGNTEISKISLQNLGFDRARITEISAANANIEEGIIDLATLKDAEIKQTENPYKEDLTKLSEAALKARAETLIRDAKALGLSPETIDKAVTYLKGRGGFDVAIKEVNVGALQSLANQLASDFEQNAISPTRRALVSYMVQQLMNVGDSTLSEGDILAIPKDRLEELTKLAEENVDGSLDILQEWATKTSIAGAKNITFLGADSPQFEKLKSDYEKAVAAMSENFKPLMEGWETFWEWLNENSKTQAFKEAESWLDVYGDKIEEGINGGGMTNPASVVSAINEKYGKAFKVVTAAMLKDKKFKGFNVGDVIYFDKNGAVKAGDKDYLASKWQEILTHFEYMRKIAGRDQTAKIAEEVQAIVEQGLKDGMDLDQLRAIIPPQFWDIWMSDRGGQTSGAERLATSLKQMVKDGVAGANIEIPEIIKKNWGTEQQRAAILAAINGVLPKDKQLVGANGWNTFKTLWNNPEEFETWLATTLATSTNKGIQKGLVAVNEGGKKKQTGAAGSGKTGGSVFSSMVTGLFGDIGAEIEKAASAVFGPEKTAKFLEGGKNIIKLIGDGFNDPAVIQHLGTGMNKSLSEVLKYIPQSPPLEGPLKGTVLPQAGTKIIELISSGFSSGVKSLTLGMLGALSAGIGSKSLASAYAYLAGYNIGDRIADGIEASVNRIRAAIASLAKALLNLLPWGSPAKQGPFASVAWNAPFQSGVNLTSQMTKGLNKNKPTLPGLSMADSLYKAKNGEIKGASQKIYADKLQVFSEPDKTSILETMRFMAPGGR